MRNAPLKVSRARGIAILVSLLVAMSIYVMITVMIADLRMEFAATKFDAKSVQDRYRARAACAEVGLRLLSPDSTNLRDFSEENPYHPEGYEPPVSVWLTEDPRTPTLVHLHAKSGNELSVRVFRRAALAESRIYSALIGPTGMRLHSLSVTESTTRDKPGGELAEETTPWEPIATPPGFVYDRNGNPVTFADSRPPSYVADLRGGMFSLLSGEEGFGLYKYEGGQAWSRLPARPEVEYRPSTGSFNASGGYFADQEEKAPIWDVSRDGGRIWFVESEDFGGSTASYLQFYDVEAGEWQNLAIPAMNLADGTSGTCGVKDVAAGEAGNLFLLTDTTPAGIIRFDGEQWSTVPNPPREYYREDNATLVQEAGQLDPETLAIGPDNLLYTSSQVEPGLYAIHRHGETGWDLGVDKTLKAAELPSRNLPSGGGFRSLSVDAAGKVIIAAAKAPVVRGQKEDGKFRRLPDLGQLAAPGEQVWSSVGGGIAGTTTSAFRETAEY